jgi:hypothetical protein
MVSIILVFGTQLSSFCESRPTDLAENQITTTVVDTVKEKPEFIQEGDGAMKVYKDPKTGDIVTPPPEMVPEDMPKKTKDAVSTSHEGLKETEVDKPGGGIMVNLKGRFRQFQEATKDGDGNIFIHCTSKGSNTKDTQEIIRNKAEE